LKKDFEYGRQQLELESPDLFSKRTDRKLQKSSERKKKCSEDLSLSPKDGAAQNDVADIKVSDVDHKEGSEVDPGKSSVLGSSFDKSGHEFFTNQGLHESRTSLKMDHHSEDPI